MKGIYEECRSKQQKGASLGTFLLINWGELIYGQASVYVWVAYFI